MVQPPTNWRRGDRRLVNLTIRDEWRIREALMTLARIHGTTGHSDDATSLTTLCNLYFPRTTVVEPAVTHLRLTAAEATVIRDALTFHANRLEETQLHQARTIRDVRDRLLPGSMSADVVAPPPPPPAPRYHPGDEVIVADPEYGSVACRVDLVVNDGDLHLSHPMPGDSRSLTYVIRADRVAEMVRPAGGERRA